MRRLKLFLLAGFLFVTGCGGASTLEGNSPAPPAGPVPPGLVTMRVELPTIQASTEVPPIRLVVVQVQAPQPSAPHGAVVVAQGQVEALPEDTSVRMRITDVPPGSYTVVAGLFDLEGNLLPGLDAEAITLAAGENRELVLDLNSPDPPPSGNVIIIVD